MGAQCPGDLVPHESFRHSSTRSMSKKRPRVFRYPTFEASGFKTILLMVSGTRELKYLVLGPSGRNGLNKSRATSSTGTGN